MAELAGQVQKAYDQLFRGGLVFKAHRLLYHSILDLRVIKKKKSSSVSFLRSAAEREGNKLKGFVDLHLKMAQA